MSGSSSDDSYGRERGLVGDVDAVDALKAGVRKVGLEVLHPIVAAVLHDVEFVLAGPIPGGVLAAIGWLDSIERKQRRKGRRRRG